ncbi:MAG: hypothetical protein N3E45_01120 [Oscillatoriaceae bacterium SKW80]|nr:hypothetical protein [Oscillatoriaceae bacterium SKYG93]MCX8119431.1 hypothetical protein [Oscillatoriaceae bacterium SKW80]MDW8454897.1 hypothetical protein [Oscillatoriaceae cyanobacterium SKYGB_i_bin93]HIK28324.1 hypothetical protein [Oscillatoriaceae cyanobacterium M7585_C2015_266]
MSFSAQKRGKFYCYGVACAEAFPATVPVKLYSTWLRASKIAFAGSVRVINPPGGKGCFGDNLFNACFQVRRKAAY